MPRRGFTIIELLVSISLISLLSSLILATLQEAREEARAVQVVSELQQTEKAFLLWANDADITRWWFPNELLPSSELEYNLAPLDKLIERYPNGLGKFLQREPVPPYGSGFSYDNSNDSFMCGDDVWKGVNISIRNVGKIEHFNRIDEIIDGGDGADCGRARYGGGSGSIYFQLGINAQDY